MTKHAIAYCHYQAGAQALLTFNTLEYSKFDSYSSYSESRTNNGISCKEIYDSKSKDGIRKIRRDLEPINEYSSKHVFTASPCDPRRLLCTFGL
jgi:hypothetical protein